MVKKEKSPESKRKKLEASIKLLKKKLGKKSQGQADSKERYVRRQLKRAQRKLARTQVLTLEESLALFERGTELASLCSQRLDEAELRVKKLLSSAEDSDSLEAAPFDDWDDGAADPSLPF